MPSSDATVPASERTSKRRHIEIKPGKLSESAHELAACDGAKGERMPDIVIGIVVGLASSVIFWLFTTKALCPRIVFGDGIRKTVNDTLEAGYSYAPRILNVGLRDAVDVEITVALRYDDPSAKSDFKQLVALSPTTNRVMVMRGKRIKEVLGKRRYGGNRIFEIKPQDTEELLKRAHMPELVLDGSETRPSASIRLWRPCPAPRWRSLCPHGTTSAEVGGSSCRRDGLSTT